MLDEQMKKCFAVAPRSASWSLEGGTAISPVVWGSPGLSSRPLPRSKGTMARAVRSYISMEYLRQGRTSLHTNNIFCLGRVFYIVQRGKEWHFLIKSQLCCNRLVGGGLVLFGLALKWESLASKELSLSGGFVAWLLSPPLYVSMHRPYVPDHIMMLLYFSRGEQHWTIPLGFFAESLRKGILIDRVFSFRT